jgi:hypothetical protein
MTVFSANRITVGVVYFGTVVQVTTQLDLKDGVTNEQASKDKIPSTVGKSSKAKRQDSIQAAVNPRCRCEYERR